MLAAATFTSESAVGWQTVDVPDAGGDHRRDTTYVAGYFDAQRPLLGHDRRGLRRLRSTTRRCTRCADGASGGNGVYAYGATSAFPTGSYNATNYWVDVMFPDVAAAAPGSRPVSPPPPALGAALSWTAPSTGGSAITELHRHALHRRHRADPDNGHGARRDRATVTGLTTGTAYTFTVPATQRRRHGPASAHRTRSRRPCRQPPVRADRRQATARPRHRRS